MPPTGSVHLYGVVPAATAATGADALPEGMEFVAHRELAALVRPAPAEPSRQLRAYLLEYAQTLDRLAEAGPVLPVRFGTAVPTPAAVVAEVLAPHHDPYQRALAGLADRSQFTVRARYRDDAAIREVLAERPETARLHQLMHHGREQVARGPDPRRVRLGELVARAVDAKRAADLTRLVRHVSPYAAAVDAPPPAALAGGDRIADVACLVEHERRADFEAAVAELAQTWRQRARLRLLGPMAPFHFAAGLVVTEPASAALIAGPPGRE